VSGGQDAAVDGEVVGVEAQLRNSSAVGLRLVGFEVAG
jgi:hypothetical protein